MIFNHCIYGSIDKSVGKLVLTYYNYSLEESIQKEYLLSDFFYQFNLGDHDLKGINSSLKNGDSVIIEYFNESDIKEFSDICILNLDNNIQEFNISIPTTFTVNFDEANFSVSENLVKTSNYKINEFSSYLYNYFKVTDLDLDEVKYEGNSEEWYFVPTESHRYKINQKSINKTKNIISESEYEFNAIISSATITRSNKCKGINDAIKILFLGDGLETANIKVFRDDTIIESGIMGSEVGNLFSYNFTFPSIGFYCFVIEYYDETFLVTFRVEQNNFKVYYSDENHEDGLTINYDMYSLADLNTPLESSTFNSVGSGIYTTAPLMIEYGDYLFKVNGEEFVTSFEECGAICEDNPTGGVTTSNKEEIFWIFPNNISD